MTESSQRTLVVTFGVIVVLFLLLDGGTLAGALVDKAGPMSAATWLWVAPTLLIFGLGFVLGWMVFGNGIQQDEVGESAAAREEPLPYLTRRDTASVDAAMLARDVRMLPGDGGMMSGGH